MLDAVVNQAAGLMGLESRGSARIVPVVCHGDEKAELPLLWRLCSTLSEFGYPVTVLDATTPETQSHPGLEQRLAYQFGNSSHAPTDPEWAVLAAANGLAMLKTLQPQRHKGVNRLGEIFAADSLLVLYASADLLVQLLAHSQVKPLLVVSPAKSALLTSYLALKRLLVNGGLDPIILHMMQVPAKSNSNPGMSVASNLTECAKNFLGYDIEAMTLDLASTNDAMYRTMRVLATRLLESAFTLHPQFPAALNDSPMDGWTRPLARNH